MATGVDLIYGVNLVAAVKPLMAKGLLRWSDRFWTGPLPVTMAWMKNPSMENIACMYKHREYATHTEYL